jgi:uncharacterized protein YbaR (Trm112 family)/GTP:adenosylcobinamide-phosphate guanylyltransferase
MDHRLLEIIACPVCNGKLYYSQDKQELICKLDNLAFPLRDGIPVLLETEARYPGGRREQTMSFVVIIPARYASTRLPGKPLVDINGKPMIVHVLERARESGAERVIVATDHPDVARAVEAAGGEVCMTRADHQSGTERLAEVVEKCGFSDDTVIVNVQGDEPMIPAVIIRQVAENLAQRQVGMATLAVPDSTLKRRLIRTR